MARELINYTGSYQVRDLSLEQMLKQLDKYCFTKIFCCSRDGSWHAFGDMRIKVEGATFKVDSEFYHATPTSAVAQLLDRVENAVKQFSENQK